MEKNRGRLVAMSFFAVAVAGLACGGSDSSSAGPKGRGTPVCGTWQTAICSFAAKCGTMPASTCQEQATAVACISDQKARDCASKLAAATCTSPPSGCDLKDMADPAPAQVACQQYVDETCAFMMRCTPALTLDACRQEAAANIDCTKAVGVTLAFEECITEIRAMTCAATTTPASCSKVILLSS